MSTIRLIPNVGLVQEGTSGSVRLIPSGLVLDASGGAAPTATLSGSATASITETDINDGGKQIILELTNDTWVAAGTAFDAIRQDILNGLVSAQNEQFGWNNIAITAQPVTAVVRTSPTRVTITLVAA